jgi:hypothetical protein
MRVIFATLRCTNLNAEPWPLRPLSFDQKNIRLILSYDAYAASGGTPSTANLRLVTPMLVCRRMTIGGWLRTSKCNDRIDPVPGRFFEFTEASANSRVDHT